MTSDKQPPPLPLWLKAAGSVFLLAHFLILGANVLSSPSGPWPTPFGESTAEGPMFATAITRNAGQYYLTPLRLTHDYHFDTNRVARPEVKFDIKLYDHHDRLIKTLHFPESGGNLWVRHRFELLAQNLGSDIPMNPRMGESVAPPDKLARTIPIWEAEKGNPNHTIIKHVAEHALPRTFGFRPSPGALLAAEAYVRYQCRLHGAKSGELIRKSKPAVQPSLMLVPDQAAAMLQELVSSFGKVTL